MCCTEFNKMFGVVVFLLFLRFCDARMVCCALYFAVRCTVTVIFLDNGV